METMEWIAGDTLKIRAHASEIGKGLSYTAGEVIALDAGFSGGWDVFDSVTDGNVDVSFYGFSVERVIRAGVLSAPARSSEGK